jgi:hypothetical protein
MINFSNTKDQKSRTRKPAKTEGITGNGSYDITGWEDCRKASLNINNYGLKNEFQES